MKYRIRYDSTFGEYIPEFKLFMFWHEFKHSETIQGIQDYICFNTRLEAEEFLNTFK